MPDWISVCLGMISSLVIALISYHYQVWKRNTEKRVALFFQTKNRILLNRSILFAIQVNPQGKEYLLDKIQFFPSYPFADFYDIDDIFRISAQIYDQKLIRIISGELDFASFSSTSDSALNAMDGLIRLWSECLKKHTFGYLFLPFLLRGKHLQITQENQSPKE